MGRRVPDELRDLIGHRVGQRETEYTILEYLGSGRRSVVFRGQSVTTGGDRAIKFIPEENLISGWEAEMLKAHKLEKQPNTVRFYTSFLFTSPGEEMRTYAVLVFDLVRGRNLRQWIKRGRLTLADVGRILRDLLVFRRDCARVGMRHGDLHPGNIILHKPDMGPDRGYEVMVTDFGVGYTGGKLTPKDDIVQIGDISVRMLQSISRERLTPPDRRAYEGLLHGAAIKRLREASAIERRGDETLLIDEVLAEVRATFSRAREATPEPPPRRRSSDYLAAEQLGDRWEEWRSLFVPRFPGFEDIVSRNITVLTGTRGCGKTMVFRRLSTLLRFQVGPLADAAAASFVGFYLNMNDVADAFLLPAPRRPDEVYARRVIQFFHLCLASEVVRVAAVARSKADPSARDAYDAGNRWIFDFVLTAIGVDSLYPGPEGFDSVLRSEIDRAKDDVRRSPGLCPRLSPLGELDWLARFVPQLQEGMPWVAGRPVYFFVDDYSLPRVGEAIQRSLNLVIFRRSENFFFKISTEAPSTFTREDYSGKILQDPHDFELTDLGSVTIDLSDEERERFLSELFAKRLNRETRFRDCTLKDVLGSFRKSWAQLAREIRGEASQNETGSPPERKRSRVLYHGHEVFVNMWSGDTRDMVRIAQSLIDELPATEQPDLPVGPEAQDKVFRRTGGEFLHLLEACTRTSKLATAQDAPEIESWGKHLVTIANAFKSIALHELLPSA